MALLITYTNNLGVSQRRVWHHGEPLPRMDCRVVSFQADGDELGLIVDALKKTRPVPTASAVVVTDPKLETK